MKNTIHAINMIKHDIQDKHDALDTHDKLDTRDNLHTHDKLDTHDDLDTHYNRYIVNPKQSSDKYLVNS